MTVKDKRGRAPAYVIQGMTLVHQPSGQTERLKSRTKGEMRRAHEALKLKVTEHDDHTIPKAPLGSLSQP